MGWSLGLSLGPGGVGSAVGLSGGGVHLIGVFPTITRAVLVHPVGLTIAELGRHLGDLALTGLDVDDVQLRTDVEVLHAVTGHRVLLIDADRDLIAAHPGRTSPFEVDRLAALVAKQPHDTTVALTGHPETRDRYHVAARDYAPLLVERPALAALALQIPAATTLVSTPRTAGALRRRPPSLLILAALPVIVVLLLLLLL
jgi:hypothetical protein